MLTEDYVVEDLYTFETGKRVMVRVTLSDNAIKEGRTASPGPQRQPQQFPPDDIALIVAKPRKKTGRA